MNYINTKLGELKIKKHLIELHEGIVEQLNDFENYKSMTFNELRSLRVIDFGENIYDFLHNKSKYENMTYAELEAANLIDKPNAEYIEYLMKYRFSSDTNITFEFTRSFSLNKKVIIMAGPYVISWTIAKNIRQNLNLIQLYYIDSFGKLKEIKDKKGILVSLVKSDEMHDCINEVVNLNI